MSEEDGENDISTEFNPSLSPTPVQDQTGYGEEDRSEQYDFSSDEGLMEHINQIPDEQDACIQDDNSILHIIRNQNFNMVHKKEIYLQNYRTQEFIYTVYLGQDIVGKTWRKAMLSIYFAMERRIEEAQKTLQSRDNLLIDSSFDNQIGTISDPGVSGSTRPTKYTKEKR